MARRKNAPQWLGLVAAILIALGGEAASENNPIVKKALRYGGVVGGAVALYFMDPRKRAAR